MKKILIGTLAGAFVLALLAMPTSADKGGKNAGCVKITDRVLTYSPGRYLAGELLKPGFDIFGYNYQAHLFRGYYINYYLNVLNMPPYEGDDEAYLEENPGADSLWLWPDRKIMLLMWWNDAWLSNKDCDGDGLLDRHYGYDSYIGSGAWETNHMWGTYEDDNGKTCHWSYFVKIITAFTDWTVVNGNWFDGDGNEIGPVIWGAFAVILEFENDPCAGGHIVYYFSPSAKGFGKYGPNRP